MNQDGDTVLDLCSTGGGPAHDVVAILTEVSRLTISDDGVGGARVYDAAMAHSPDALYLRAFLGVPALRTCDASELLT